MATALSAPAEERSVYSLIREAAEVAKAPDTAAIAEQVLEEMTVEELRRYAATGVRSEVRTYFAKVRHLRNRNGNGNGSARWDSVKAGVASGELDLARYSVFTGQSRKWLLDCNASDLHGAAEFHRDRGDRHLAMAEAMEGLAKTLEARKGAEVVGDLPEQKVRGLLNA